MCVGALETRWTCRFRNKRFIFSAPVVELATHAGNTPGREEKLTRKRYCRLTDANDNNEVKKKKFSYIRMFWMKGFFFWKYTLTGAREFLVTQCFSTDFLVFLPIFLPPDFIIFLTDFPGRFHPRRWTEFNLTITRYV